MPKSKEDLLKELEAMGVPTDKPPRKPRSDRGEIRGIYKPRSDKGKVRGSYINTAAKYRAVYEKMLTSHQTEQDGYDTLNRDKNMIFPPNQNKFNKLIKGKDRTYYTKAVKPAHLEQARWRWFMAEYEENPEEWAKKISDWYFIQEDEISMWMYTEWAWAYVHVIGGDENRLCDNPIIMKYDDYVAGLYGGYPNFDARGEIVWKIT